MTLKLLNVENLGTLQDFGPKAVLKFAPLTFIYGPNAGGKTTGSTILHSVSANLPKLLKGRHKLGAQHPVSVGLTIDESQQVTFTSGEWSQAIPGIMVFDDRFIAEHVFGGLSVTGRQLQNLCEFAIGDVSVKLNQQLTECSARLEELQSQLLKFDKDIPMDARPGLSVAEFVKVSPDIEFDDSDTVDVNAIESYDSDALSNHITQHVVMRNRRDPQYSKFCKDFIDTTKKIQNTEKEMAEIRQQILALKQQVIPEYFEKINRFLKEMGANFKIVEVENQDVTQANQVDYYLQIKSHDIPLDADASTHQFANTLSAGDRNTLALAFFFAKLELDSDLKDKIIVFDDPISSMDTSRAHILQNAIARLARKVKTIIIFSHSKPFLRGTYRACREVKKRKTGYELKRSTNNEMVFRKWDIQHDLIIDFHQRLNRIKNFVKDGCSEELEQVAFDLRMVLETYCQVHFGVILIFPDTLGKFSKSLRAGTSESPISVSNSKAELLEDLVNYSNPFHHIERDTLDGEVVTDNDLLGYAKKLLVFMDFLDESE